MAVLASVNQKGGVGKTTVVLGLAAVATRRGLRVLVIDVDPQANATSGLGVWDPPLTVDQVLAAEEPGAIRAAVMRSGWPEASGPPDLVAGTPTLAEREPQLVVDPVGAQDRLFVAMGGVADDYDLVLIDCPPSLSLLTVNGLFAADQALVVTEPAAWASDGVQRVLQTIERIGSRRHGALAVAGLVVNRVGRTRDARYWHTQLEEQYRYLATPPIYQRTAIAEASAQSLPITALGRRPGAAEAADDFDMLLTHLLLPAEPAAVPVPASPQAVTAAPSGPSDPSR